MPFLVKTTATPSGLCIRGNVLVKKPVTVLQQVANRLDKAIHQEKVTLSAFLNIEGTFDNTSFVAIITACRNRGLEDTCCS